MLPRYGRPPVNGQRYARRPGAYAILPMQDGLLLTHQEEPKPEFQLPGGGIDPGEHVIPALRREILEETGWRVGPVTRFGIFRRFAYMPEYDLWADKICTIYIARPTHCLGPPSEPGHSALVVDALSAIELVGNDGDRSFLRKAMQRGLIG